MTGQIAVQTPAKNATFPVELTYQKLDSVTILLRDPLGRKQIKIQTHTHGYELWLLRERKYYSGRGLPTQLLSYPIPAVSVRELHRLLLGLMPCAPPVQLSADSLTCPSDTAGHWIFTLDPEQRLLQSGSLYAASDQPVTQIQYQDYEYETGLSLPATIFLTSPADSVEILIHFSHFSVQFHKFTERSNKPRRIKKFWQLPPRKISSLS